MRIAVIGSGIAGNTVAHRLHRDHDITLFESESWLGGHTHTVDVEWQGRSYAIDTGFIVCNDWTYPNFLSLLAELGVETQPSTMSFSVRCERSGLEYNGTTLNSLFAQRSNLLRPSFYRMIAEILRFNREAPQWLHEKGAVDVSLGEFLRRGRYGSEFSQHYLLPMGAAIWSAHPDQMLACPAQFFIRFFHNHGMLSVDRRPQWRVVRDGSRSYVEKLIAPFKNKVRVGTGVVEVRRLPSGVEVISTKGERLHFDAAFIACHSDDALRMVKDRTEAEREVLGAIGYQSNEVVLHTDTRLLPKRKLAWAAWNYHLVENGQRSVAVTYNMNMLQSLEAPATFCVTLNRSEAIDPSKIIGRYVYRHPLFTAEAVAAQARQRELNDGRGIYYCGAYWRYGFHEDGVVSALNALQHFNEHTEHAQLSLRRLG